jgi:hypothetical protein
LKNGNILKFCTNNGREFIVSIEARQFKDYSIKLHHGASKHPQTQGAIEFVHKTIEIEAMKYLIENNTNHWIPFVKFFLQKYRHIIHSSTNKTPFELMFN